MGAVKTLSDRINPRSAALLVIDMQNDFASPKGRLAEFGFEIGAVRESVPAIRRLLEAARGSGYPVIHTCVLNDRERNPSSWYAFWGEPAMTLPGSWGAAHIDELEPRAGEQVISKYTYGAFVGTNLDPILRQSGIETLVLTGTDFNICVGDTLHHAFALGYHVVAVSDCVSCFSKHDRRHADQLKQAGMYLIENHYGTVIASSELIGLMQKGS